MARDENQFASRRAKSLQRAERGIADATAISMQLTEESTLSPDRSRGAGQVTALIRRSPMAFLASGGGRPGLSKADSLAPFDPSTVVVVERP